MTSGPEPQLLFLHPVGLNAGCAAWLSLPGLRSMTFPGHGNRLRARPGLTLRDMADEIVGWTSGPLDVAGASLGGMVALHLALDHPERVRSLVLACTTPRGDPAVHAERAAATEKRGSAGILEETLARWFTPAWLARAPSPPQLGYALTCLAGMDAGALADTWRAIAGHDVTARLGEITAPVTCIAGLRDVSTPPQVVAGLAERLPRSRLAELDAPHMAFLEQPGQFSELVRDHLTWAREQPGKEGRNHDH